MLLEGGFQRHAVSYIDAQRILMLASFLLWVSSVLGGSVGKLGKRGLGYGVLSNWVGHIYMGKGRKVWVPHISPIRGENSLTVPLAVSL